MLISGYVHVKPTLHHHIYLKKQKHNFQLIPTVCIGRVSVHQIRQLTFSKQKDLFRK